MLRCNMQENCSTISLRSVLDISRILTRRIAEHGYVTYVTQHADLVRLSKIGARKTPRSGCRPNQRSPVQLT